MIEIKIKKLVEEAVIPQYAKPGDAGMDITAIGKEYDVDGNVVYKTGLAFAIPEGYVGLLFPRSSVSKQNLSLSNSVGVIDSGYRGEVIFKFKPTLEYTMGLDTDSTQEYPKDYNVGDRIGQIIVLPYPQIKFTQVEELSETIRGTGGFGHTGL